MVEAEILDYDIDENGNIRVSTQYKVDGVEVISKYPKTSDGKSYFVTRYDVTNFAGMNDNEILVYIKNDIDKHCETLVKKTFIKKQNEEIKKSRLLSLKGTKVQRDSANIKVSSGANTNELNKQWNVKTDGSKNEIDYTPPSLSDDDNLKQVAKNLIREINKVGIKRVVF